MRLTLRTLLAYLDDLLKPTDAREIGKKLGESAAAGNMATRIRDVLRRRRIEAPPVDADPDPNAVAEYLDNILPDAEIEQHERSCLSSDEVLAETAACHQILTLVLGKPVAVSGALRSRAYDLVEPASLTDEQTDVPVPETPVEASGVRRASSATAPSSDELLPSFLKAARSSHWKELIGGGAVLVGGALLFVALLKTDDSYNARPDEFFVVIDESPMPVPTADEPAPQSPTSEETNVTPEAVVVDPKPPVEPEEPIADVADVAPVVANSPSIETAADPVETESAATMTGPAAVAVVEPTEPSGGDDVDPAAAIASATAASPSVEPSRPPVIESLPQLSWQHVGDGIALHMDRSLNGWSTLERDMMAFPQERVVVPRPFEAEFTVESVTVRVLPEADFQLSAVTEKTSNGLTLTRGRVVLSVAEIVDDAAPQASAGDEASADVTAEPLAENETDDSVEDETDVASESDENDVEESSGEGVDGGAPSNDVVAADEASDEVSAEQPAGEEPKTTVLSDEETNTPASGQTPETSEDAAVKDETTATEEVVEPADSVRNVQSATTFGLAVGEHTAVLELTPGATVAIEVTVPEPGHIGTAHDQTPTTTLYVLAGSVSIDGRVIDSNAAVALVVDETGSEGAGEPVATAAKPVESAGETETEAVDDAVENESTESDLASPIGPQQWVLFSDAEPERVGELPDWVTPSRPSASVRRARVAFRKLLPAQRTLVPELVAIQKEPGALTSELATATLALLGEGESLIDALDSPYHETRLQAVRGIRRWLANDVSRVETLPGRLGTLYRTETVDRLARLLVGYSADDLHSPTQSRVLLGDLASDEVAVREAAFFHVQLLTSQDFGYDPDGGPQSRNMALRRWEEFVEREGAFLTPVIPDEPPVDLEAILEEEP